MESINNSNDRRKLLDTYMAIIDKDYKGINLTYNQIVDLLEESFGTTFTFDEMMDYLDRTISGLDIEDIKQQVSNLGIIYD